MPKRFPDFSANYLFSYLERSKFLVSKRTKLYLTLGNALVIFAIAVFFCASSPAQSSTDATREAQRLTRVAQVAQQQGRYDDAIKAYQTITVIAAGSPQIAASAQVATGNIFMMTGRFEDAATAFRKAVSLDPASAEAINNLGEALGELKQFQPALQAFQKAAALDPKYLKARYNMGVTYDRLGQMKYAEFIYRILIRDFPDFALGYDSLAVSLSKSGRAREAAPFHEKAISLAPGDPSFYFNYSLTCLMLGDFKKAQEQQQKLRALDPAMAEHLAMMIAKRRQ
jgi:tetratricopeptide (TPR) repeat protein